MYLVTPGTRSWEKIISARQSHVHLPTHLLMQMFANKLNMYIFLFIWVGGQLLANQTNIYFSPAGWLILKINQSCECYQLTVLRVSNVPVKSQLASAVIHVTVVINDHWRPIYCPKASVWPSISVTYSCVCSQPHLEDQPPDIPWDNQWLKFLLGRKRQSAKWILAK